MMQFRMVEQNANYKADALAPTTLQRVCRSIVCARDALSGQIRREHEVVCRHLQDAQLRFLQSKPLITSATGYTGCENTLEQRVGPFDVGIQTARI